jgi:hypothetical protein
MLSGRRGNAESAAAAMRAPPGVRLPASFCYGPGAPAVWAGQLRAVRGLLPSGLALVSSLLREENAMYIGIGTIILIILIVLLILFLRRRV